MRTAFAALLPLLSLAAPAAGEPVLSLPVNCTLGETCYIQQFMDHDATEGVQDFLCEPMSYDTHKGTDFALPSVVAAQAGVQVLAAAPGTVLGVRDGMDDIWSGDINASDIAGRECGNGLVIDHGQGWQTQYCHLKKGSLSVQSGATVTPDTVLGQIGMSGRSQFPHLHLSVRKDGRPVDPFAPGGADCTKAPERTMWADQITHQPGGIIAMGFAAQVPDYSDVKRGTADQTITRTAPAIVSYGYAFGGREGDVFRMSLTGPGAFSVTDAYVLPRNRAQFFRAIGKKRRSAPWPGGVYVATAVLERGGRIVSQQQTSFDIPR